MNDIMRSPLKTCLRIVVALCVTAASGHAGQAPAAKKAPAAEKRPVTDSYHGIKVVDDYRWLENWDDPAVKQWSAAENTRTREYLDALPSRPAIKQRLEAADRRVGGILRPAVPRGDAVRDEVRSGEAAAVPRRDAVGRRRRVGARRRRSECGQRQGVGVDPVLRAVARRQAGRGGAHRERIGRQRRARLRDGDRQGARRPRARA